MKLLIFLKVKQREHSHETAILEILHQQDMLPSTQLDKTQQTSLDKLLQQYQNLFESPKGLPPNSDLDHRIPLKEGITGIKSKPYWYAHYQKEEIEKQVSEMLQQGIIQFSSSHFSSPVLFVKKQDGSWRMCVDYRNLNAAIIKYHFPIPVIDELLDELYGAEFFSNWTSGQGITR